MSTSASVKVGKKPSRSYFHRSLTTAMIPSSINLSRSARRVAARLLASRARTQPAMAASQAGLTHVTTVDHWPEDKSNLFLVLFRKP